MRLCERLRCSNDGNKHTSSGTSVNWFRDNSTIPENCSSVIKKDLLNQENVTFNSLA